MALSGTAAWPEAERTASATTVAGRSVPDAGTEAEAAEGVAEASRGPRAVPGQYVVRLRTGVALAKAGALLADLGSGIREVRRLRGTAVQLQAQPGRVGGGSFFDEVALVVAGDQAGAGDLRARLERHPAVAYVEPNSILTLCQAPPPERVPDDFRFNELWHLRNQGQGGGRPGADISAPAAWAYTTGDARIKVAVVDTGIDYFHPDLVANLWINPGEIPGNGIDDDHNGYIDDVHGYDFVSDDGDPMDDQMHGTHVAGIIGATGDNLIGTSGVCWQVSLMAIKAFNESGEASLFEVIGAMRYAVANGARVLNASWGQPDKSRALADAIAEVHQAGLVIVAAAGNNRSEVLSYPAAYPEAVTVAATNNRDQRSIFSSYGSHVDLAAPGDNILSTVPDNRFELASGTSMAAPQVSGVAALVLSRHPDWNNTQVADVLRNATDPLTGTEYIGTGRLNAWKAVRPEQPLPTARLDLPGVLSGRIDVRGTATSAAFLRYTLDYAQGIYPTNWTHVFTGEAPVDHGVLMAGLSTAIFPEGTYVFRLIVQDTLGQEAMDRTTVSVKNVQLSSPTHNDILRAGDRLTLRGTVFGPGRTYTIEHGVGGRPSTWATQGITLAADGQQEVIAGVLGTWDTTAVSSNQFYTLKLTAWAEGRVVGTSLATMVYLDGRLRPGWPQYVDAPSGYSTNDWRHVTVADLDHDGRQEILAMEAGNNEGKRARLLVYSADGRLEWAQELPGGDPTSDIPVVGDLDGDGYAEVLVDTGDSGLVFAFTHDGRPLGDGWPAQVGARNLGKVLADLDGDGKLELVGYGESTTEELRETRVLVVVNTAGQLVRRWKLEGSSNGLGLPRMFPAVGDLDDDPELEIVAVAGADGVALFDLSQADGPVWKAQAEGSFFSSPAIGDVDGDERNEIVLTAYDTRSGGAAGTHGGVHVFDRFGRPLPGWPVLIDESFAAPPALGDFTGAGPKQIVAVNWDRRVIHLLQSDGFEPPGWPVGPILANPGAPFPVAGWAKSMPLIGDIDGDGSPDVILITPGQQQEAARSGDGSLFGGVKAWSFQGANLDLNARPELRALVMEASSGNRLKAAPPVLTDLDGNGRLDVVASTVEDVAYASDGSRSVPKNRYTLYAWELDAPYATNTLPWPMFQRDPQRSGYLPTPKPINQPPIVTPIPNQTIRSGTTFFPIELNRYVEDPDNALADLVWTVEGARELQVNLSPNRVVAIRPPSPTWTGAELIRFTVRDPGGLTASVSATYAARVDYDPPVAQDDAAEVPEDGEVELAPLANDTHPRGLALSLLQVSRAQTGTVTLLPDNRVRYRPKADFSGEDSFTYTVGDGLDGMAMGRVTLRVTPAPDAPIAVEDHALTFEDTPVPIDVLVNDSDPDGDPLTLADFSQPAKGIVEAGANRSLIYRPGPGGSGSDQFTYRITDGTGREASATVSVLVKPVNHPPVCLDLSFVLNRNTSQELVFQGRDPDGDTLSYEVRQGPAHGELWAYPKVATYYPKKGYSGTDLFTYTASDGEHTSAPATASFIVIDANNPPAGEPQSLVTKVGRPLAFSLKATDVDDDPLSFLITRWPLHGALSGVGSNYVYAPEPAFLGEDAFAFVANDGQANSPSAGVSLRITDQNTAPVAESYSVEIRMNTPTVVVLRAGDGENDPLSYTVVTNPFRGQLSGVAPNLLYTPPKGYYGPDRFAFTVNDGEAGSEPGVVSIAVAQPNHPPLAVEQTLNGSSDTPIAFALTVTDEDGDGMQAAILKGPKNGRVAGLGTTFTYVPKAGFMGADSFTYKVWDGLAYSQIGKVSIFVRPPLPPTPPRFEGIKRLDSGAIQMRIETQAGKRLEVQVSTNLVDWAQFLELIPAEDTVTLVDTNAVAVPQQYYRALRP